MSHQSTALRARYVFPVVGPPLDGGVVVVEGTQVAAVGRHLSTGPVDDLGDVAILPGLVNAHSHLEFSLLEEPLGTPGMSLPEWLGLVIGHRQGVSDDPARAVARGFAECIGAGTTAIGEIATTDWRGASGLPSEVPATEMFHEAIGPTLARARTAAASAEAFLKSANPRVDVTPGLSPHAPYTVHPHLLAALVELSQRYRVPLAMHLAESPDELELLHLSSGPFRDLLESVGAWDPDSESRLTSIIDYLAALARAPRALVIHGNYLDDEEIEFLAEHQETMSVVYCPRTHDFFAHEPYPLGRLLAAGVSVALGTDSRASNPDLSVLAEMRQAADAHPDVKPATLLHLATLGGAGALGLDDRLGTIEPGKQANLAVVALPDDTPLDPCELLLSPEAHVVQTWLRGRRTGTAS